MLIPSRLRVLHLVKGLGLGGAERLIADSLPLFNSEEVVSEVAYFLPWKDHLAGQIRREGWEVHCLNAKGNKGMPASVWRLQRLVSRGRFDLIHSHLPVSGVAARVVGKMHGVPVVYTEHNLQQRYHPVTRWLNKMTFEWNSHVVAVSDEVARSLKNAGLDEIPPIETIRNGVSIEAIEEEGRSSSEVREELGIPSDVVVVGVVAVFRTQKRLGDWLAVARRVCEKNSDVIFLLAGDGPEAERVQEARREYSLERRVLMPGFRPDGRAAVGAMDIFLMTSEFEGLPVALLEAMALGKPVVVTRAGGIPEAVTEGKEGYLLPIGEVGPLAERVLRLVEDVELRRRMGSMARETVKKSFDVRKNIKRLEEIYRLVAGRV